MQNAGLDELKARIRIARRNINNLRHADDTTLMADSEEELKNFLMNLKEENGKRLLKTQMFKKLRSWHHFMANRWGNSGNSGRLVWSHHFMANRWENSGRLYFGGLQNHCR